MIGAPSAVSRAGVEAVISALLAHCEVTQFPETAGAPVSDTELDAAIRSAGAATLSRLLAEAECEEAMTDPAFHGGNGKDAIG